MEGLKITAGVIGIAVTILGAILVLVSLVNNYTCHRYGRITNHEVRTAFPGVCYVNTDKGWFTYEQIRSIN